MVASRSPSVTGKREWPDSRAVDSKSSTVASAASDTMVERGVIRSSAVVSPNFSELCSICAFCLSSAPCWAELRTSAPSSCGERADASSSAGSMPILRTIQLAVTFIDWMKR